MALTGKPSTAHRFNTRGECIHCGMYAKVVKQLTHVCTMERELEEDGWWCGKNHREVLKEGPPDTTPLPVEAPVGKLS